MSATTQNDFQIIPKGHGFVYASICDSGSYSTQHNQHFLRAISHSLGAHTAAFDVVLDASDAEDDDHQQQQQQQQPTQQDDNIGASTSALNDTQSDDTCEVCSSLHALASVSYTHLTLPTKRIV